MAPTKIHTRFLILSDTHNYTFPLKPSKFETKKLLLPTPHADVVLHCGDLTEHGGIPAYKRCLAMLSSIDADLKLVIAGNHDLSLDGKFWASNCTKWNGDEHGKATELVRGDIAKEAGVVYLVSEPFLLLSLTPCERLRFFVMSTKMFHIGLISIKIQHNLFAICSTGIKRFSIVVAWSAQSS